MLSLQQELEALREERAREKDIADRRQRQDRAEIEALQERCDILESNGGGGSVSVLVLASRMLRAIAEFLLPQVDSAILDQLRSGMEGLLGELTDLSRRNDELMSAKDNDLVVIRDLEAQMKEYKRKYEQAKTELRSAKGLNLSYLYDVSSDIRHLATSQLFLQPPKVDDQLPVSREGGLVDIHVTAFVSSVDSLLTAGRSNAPTRVLQPMKGVVNAVTAISDDVRAFERRPQRERAEVDVEALQSLRERLDATLSNLVQAAKTHATSAGMAPVSLLDAAASHVSATVTDIGKTVHIRKATKAEQDAFAPTMAAGTTSSTNGYTPSLRTVEELRSAHQRSGSSASSRGGDDLRSSPTSSPKVTPRRPPSNMSSSNASSPPPLFEKSKMNGSRSDSSVNGEAPEDAWAELKVRVVVSPQLVMMTLTCSCSRIWRHRQKR